jgi:hypothetical protein
MKCKYCGYQMVGNKRCDDSPSKTCVGVPDGDNCVYCSRKFVRNASCAGNSPSRTHFLA